MNAKIDITDKLDQNRLNAFARELAKRNRTGRISWRSDDEIILGIMGFARTHNLIHGSALITSAMAMRSLTVFRTYRKLSHPKNATQQTLIVAA